jgi:hypothetical protein
MLLFWFAGIFSQTGFFADFLYQSLISPGGNIEQQSCDWRGGDRVAQCPIFRLNEPKSMSDSCKRARIVPQKCLIVCTL